MLDAKALANASSIVALVLYALCALLSYIAPDLLFNFAAMTMHTINLESVRATTVNFSLTNLVFGALLWAALTWVTVYATVYLYNRLRK